MRKTLLILFLLLALVSCTLPPPPDLTQEPSTATPLLTATVTDEATPTAETPPTSVATITNTPRPTASNTARPATVTVAPTVVSTATPSATPLMKLGLNANGLAIPNRSVYLDFVRAMCSPQLIMDNFELALEVYSILTSCSSTPPIVISREYSAQEGGECTQTSAQTMVTRWINNNNHYASNAWGVNPRNIIRYSVNEPVYSESTWVQCLNRERQLMQLARNAGITVSMTNFAVGTVQPQWVEAGLFDDYLRDIDRYNQCIGAHEYTSAVLSFGVGRWAMEALTDPARVAPALWVRVQDIPMARQPQAARAQTLEPQLEIDTSLPFGQAAYEYHYGLLNRDGISAQGALGTTLPTYWHMRRADWFPLRADVIRHMDGSRVVIDCIFITEGVFDHLDDINAVLKPLESQYGLPEFMYNLRGIPTLCNLWRFYWSFWSCDEAAFQQLRHANEVIYHPPQYRAILLFTCSNNPMWNAYDICNNAVGNGVRSRLINYAATLRR